MACILKLVKLRWGNYPINRFLQKGDKTRGLGVSEIMTEALQAMSQGHPNVIILPWIDGLGLNFVPNTGKIVVKDVTK